MSTNASQPPHAAQPQAAAAPYDDSDEEDLLDEEFMNDIEEGLKGIDTNAMTHEEANQEVKTVATNKDSVRRSVGDFEVLRLAKRGDSGSFFDFASVNNINVKTFKDNKQRTCLHYAADGGNEQLIEALLACGVPVTADEHGLLPVDVAILNGCSDAIVRKLGVPRSRDDTLEEQATKPPAFVLSQKAPLPPPALRSRGFWEGNAATDSSIAVDELEETPSVFFSMMRAGTQDLESAGGVDAWSFPFSEEQVAERKEDLIGIGATKNGEAQGHLFCWKMGGEAAVPHSELETKAITSLAWAGGLSVYPPYRGTRIAAAMMKHLRSLLSPTHQAVAFAVPHKPISQPPVETCLIKTFRRSIHPERALRCREAEELYPEYFAVDSILRTDMILKESICDRARARIAAAADQWTVLSSDEDVNELIGFIALTSSKRAPYEVAYVPTTPKATRSSILAPGVVTCGLRDGGRLVDVVSFRRRFSKSAVPSGETANVVAEVVYSLLTSPTPTSDKLEQFLLLAEKHLEANTLLIPVVGGITDNDVTKSQFTECVSFRRVLYVVNGSTLKGIPKVPASKVCIPLLF